MELQGFKSLMKGFFNLFFDVLESPDFHIDFEKIVQRN